MSESLSQGIELLKQWEAFSRQQPTADLAQFGTWLQLQYENPEDDRLHQTHEEAPPEVLDRPNLLDAQIGFTWGRLMRFTQIWAKRAFRDTPIRSMEEFGILMFIFQTLEPRKSDVAQQSLMEQTTCFEIIKRFQRQGLISEFPDAQDKRSRRVRLTEEAATLVGGLLRQRAEALSTLLLGQMAKDQKMAMWDMLRTLERFHVRVLDEHPEEGIDSIVAKQIG